MADPEDSERPPHHEAPPRAESPRSDGDGQTRSRLRRLGRRLMGEEGVEGRFSARDVVDTLLEGGDKAKTEVVRVVAREVRAYLEELGLREVLTDYSLEFHGSINLRKLAEAEKAPVERASRAPTEKAPKG